MSAFLSALRPGLRASSGAARSFSSSTPCSVARMTITGRIASEPELRATASGSEVVKYTVATNTGSKDNRQSSFFRVTSFSSGSQRDVILNMGKGTLVYFEGDASMRQFENAEGVKTTTLNLVQRHIEILKRPYRPENTLENQSESEPTN
ncbi:ssDNA binding protein [Aspergillus heteromorphus CBS 117.55]|uniref:SsDNA binding protein n=1 Tax=Aspergillus heteromorphus CBS 117.55 TaxID=1448321 RepID=A0A317VLW6_9EURO|nr:ssDNA binding protein [Aspergillus heteromorphus CBS 117.55]PWY72900.1 ssDNA binding protein [Aspergillus heteromorphus CBS 117.55]